MTEFAACVASPLAFSAEIRLPQASSTLERAWSAIDRRCVSWAFCSSAFWQACADEFGCSHAKAPKPIRLRLVPNFKPGAIEQTSDNVHRRLC